jgi:hypothetical protein
MFDGHSEQVWAFSVRESSLPNIMLAAPTCGTQDLLSQIRLTVLPTQGIFKDLYSGLEGSLGSFVAAGFKGETPSFGVNDYFEVDEKTAAVDFSIKYGQARIAPRIHMCRVCMCVYCKCLVIVCIGTDACFCVWGGKALKTLLVVS